MKQTADISEWTMFGNSVTGFYLIGKVTGHVRQEEFNKFEPGLQRTSPLLDLNLKEGKAETLNTIYRLNQGTTPTKQGE